LQVRILPGELNFADVFKGGRRVASTLKWAGVFLVAIGVVGFFTVADDLRHTGEIAATGSLLAAGLIMLAVALFRRRKK